MKPLMPPVVMALIRCPIVDYFTIVPICRYPEQLPGRAATTLPSWTPPAYLSTFYGVSVPCSRTRTNAANNIRHRYSTRPLFPSSLPTAKTIETRPTMITFRALPYRTCSIIHLGRYPLFTETRETIRTSRYVTRKFPPLYKFHLR